MRLFEKPVTVGAAVTAACWMSSTAPGQVEIVEIRHSLTLDRGNEEPRIFVDEFSFGDYSETVSGPAEESQTVIIIGAPFTTTVGTGGVSATNTTAQAVPSSGPGSADAIAVTLAASYNATGSDTPFSARSTVSLLLNVPPGGSSVRLVGPPEPGPVSERPTTVFISDSSGFELFNLTTTPTGTTPLEFDLAEGVAVIEVSLEADATDDFCSPLRCELSLTDDFELVFVDGAAFPADCNGNGIPDTLDPDDNDNGIPDDCEFLPATAVSSIETGALGRVQVFAELLDPGTVTLGGLLGPGPVLAPANATAVLPDQTLYCAGLDVFPAFDPGLNTLGVTVRGLLAVRAGGATAFELNTTDTAQLYLGGALVASTFPFEEVLVPILEPGLYPFALRSLSTAGGQSAGDAPFRFGPLGSATLADVTGFEVFLPPPLCAPDYNGDGLADFVDLLSLLTDLEAGCDAP